MKVLMLFNDYLQPGGERVSVATEVDALRSAGAEVNLVAADNSNLQGLGPLGKMSATFPSQASFERVSSEIEAFQPDVVHAQNLFPQLGAGAIRAIAHANAPWVRTIRNYRKSCIAGTFTRDGQPCHDCTGHLNRIPGVIHGCYQGSRTNSVGATNYAYWDNRSERHHPPGAYILVSAAMQASIGPALRPEPRVHVVHNGVHRLALGSETAPPRERSYDVAFVGRLTIEKGVSLALGLTRSLPHLKFVFVGDGPLAAEVRAAALANPNVQLATDLDHRGAAAIMADSRIVLAPSRWDEPFGRVAAEAMAYGALPLVSSMGGLPEIVEGLPYEAVLDPRDQARWHRAIMSLLSGQPTALDQLSTACTRRWEDRFSPSALAEGLAAVYRSVLASRGK